MSRIKKGDRVRVIKEGSHNQNIGDTGIVNYVTRSYSYEVIMDKNNDKWWFADDEIELIKFEEGDIVTINENCTIADLNANYSNGCREDTFNFIEQDMYKSNHNYIIEKIVGSNSYRINEYIVNVECLKLVKKKNKVKKMTVAEINKALGYEVEIIKE